MYAWTRPQVLVPVHGEAMHLAAQARLGASAGIPQVAPVRNGDLLRLAPGPAEIIDNIPVGRIYRDGKVIGNEEEVGVGFRRKLAFAGLVACSIVIDRNGRMADEIDIVLHGLPEMTPSGDAFDDVLFDAVSGAVESIPPAKRKDEELVMRAAEKALRAAAREHWGKKPVVTVFVAKV
jgi:ribonuclease J